MGGLAGFESTALAGEAEPNEGGPDQEREEESPAVSEEPDDEPTVDLTSEPEDDPTPLPFLEADEGDLALADMEVEEESELEMEVAELGVEVSDPVPALRERVANDPTDGEGWLLLAHELLDQGHEGEGAEALQRAHQAYAAAGDPTTAIRVVEELLPLRPQQLELRQRVVEYAHMTGDKDLQLEAFMELAAALQDEGDLEHARAVLERVVKLAPDHLRARALLGEVSPEVEPTESPEPPTSQETEALPVLEREAPSASKAPKEAPESGDYVDLGALVLEERGEETTRWTVPTSAPTADEDADFRRTLAQFKAKVAENFDTDDAKGHYDLGTAYKEMGLLDEAIGEFQQSLRADPENLATFEMLGLSFLEKGEPQAAIRTLERGLRLPTQVEDDLLGIYYCLGNSNEALGNIDAAKEFYERIFALDINFKDVTDRLRDLR
jgi:tetratricopeptide (TPR) repeat protein